MNPRGWGWTAADIRQVQLIEWLAEQSAERPNVFVEVRSFYDAYHDQDGNDFVIANVDLNRLEEQALVSQASGMGGIEALAALPTPKGHHYLGKLHASRADKLQRRVACRDAMLAWLYAVDAINTANQPVRNDMLKDPRYGTWLAQPFLQTDLAEAAGWLHGQSLVRGTMASGDPGPIRLYLSGVGVTCAERFDSDTSRYLERQVERGSGPTVNIGTYSGSFQVAGDHAHQVQNVGVSAEHLRELITSLAELVRQVAPDASGLDSEREAALAAARDGAIDQTALKRFATWTLSLVGKGVSAALLPVITATTNEMLQEAARVAGHLH